MRNEATRKLFSVDEYYGMAEAGILQRGERVELIDGEIYEMSRIGNRHVGCVNFATRLIVMSLAGRGVVNVQQPDLSLLKFRTDDYRGKKVVAEDAILVLEVSDTTLRFDRNVKLPRYAAAGISEAWIENLEDDELLG